jgi:hypothetical protein
MELANSFAFALERYFELYFSPVMRRWILIGIGWLTAAARRQAPALTWDAMEKEFKVTSLVTNASRSFSVTNVSSQPIVIKGFNASCGCPPSMLNSEKTMGNVCASQIQ